jgi:NAD(P)-dependent dehydrogenase (short-subunit alcohol dehydrogenase family)
MAHVWLITGSARGLGRAIAEGVLAADDKLIATARNPQQLSDLVERYGDNVRAVALDVTDERAAIAAVQLAVDVFGRLDVLVNNAGYGNLAAIEDTTRRPSGVSRASRRCSPKRWGRSGSKSRSSSPGASARTSRDPPRPFSRTIPPMPRRSEPSRGFSASTMARSPATRRRRRRPS